MKVSARRCNRLQMSLQKRWIWIQRHWRSGKDLRSFMDFLLDWWKTGRFPLWEQRHPGTVSRHLDNWCSRWDRIHKREDFLCWRVWLHGHHSLWTSPYRPSCWSWKMRMKRRVELVRRLEMNSSVQSSWDVFQVPSRPILAWVWRKLQPMQSFEKKFFDGIELIRSGLIWFLHRMTPLIQSLWRLIESRARARATMTKEKASPTRAIRRENRSRRAKRKENQRTTTKVVNQEKESQFRIQGKEKERVIESAMFAESLATWPKIAGAQFEMFRQLLLLVAQISLNGRIWQACHSKEELAIIQFNKVPSSLSSNSRNRHLSTEFHGSLSLQRWIQWQKVQSILCATWEVARCQALHQQAQCGRSITTLEMRLNPILMMERSERLWVRFLQTLVTCVAFYLILEQMRQFSQCSLQDVETTQVKNQRASMTRKDVWSLLKLWGTWRLDFWMKLESWFCWKNV